MWKVNYSCLVLCGLVAIVHSQACFNLQFACGDGRCPSRNNDRNGVCDGVFDCSDGSDEARCGGSCTDFTRRYRCLNGLCVSGSSVCDGNDDCGDNSDEMQCGTINLIGFIVGMVVVVLVVTICCPLCIILCIVACVVGVFRRQRRIDRELRSKNIPVTTGGSVGAQNTYPTQPVESSTVQYSREEEKVAI